MPDAPYIIYLAIIGAACLSYVLYAYRGRLNAALQSALIWVLLFMGVIALYDYKENLGAMIFPNRGAQISEEIIRLPRASDGHYYADMLINGVYVEFIVDTGASAIVLSAKDAQRVGFNLDDLRYTGVAETANGMVRISEVTLDSVQLAEIEDLQVLATVTGGDTDMSLLGMSYLAMFSSVEISGNYIFLQR